MADINDKTIKLIDSALESILLNQAYTPLNTEDTNSELPNVISKINILAEYIRQVYDFSIDLSKGMLNTEPLPAHNCFAAGLIQLHAQLSRLTWQTHQIAQGDYRQIVDFIGDFAVEFNIIVKRLEECGTAINARNRILDKIFDYIECLFVLNSSNRYESFYINKTSRETFGLEESSNLHDYAENSNFIYQIINLDIDESERHEIFDSDSKRWYNIVAAPLRWINDSPALLFYCTDITNKKQREDTLERDAHIDPITGIYNRRALEIYMKRDLQQAKRLNIDISVMIIDIDFFKIYNESYGNIQGDNCLRAVAKCIGSVICRSTDFVSRFGGEEFAVMLPNTNSVHAIRLAENIRRAIEELKIPNISNPSEMTKITVSIGLCSMLPVFKTVPADLLQMAGEALYKSKISGRNCVTLADGLD